MTSAAHRAPVWVRVLGSGLCVYEITAFWTPLPTITVLCQRYPALEAGIEGFLALHFRTDTPL